MNQLQFAKYQEITSNIEKLRVRVFDSHSECPWDIVLDHYSRTLAEQGEYIHLRNWKIEFLNGKHHVHVSNSKTGFSRYIELTEMLAKEILDIIDEKEA